MALSADFSYTVNTAGTAITVTDTTVYGAGGNPARDEVLVQLYFWDMHNGEETAIDTNVDPATWTDQLIEGMTRDGWYRLRMLITTNASPYEDLSELIVDFVVEDRLFTCMGTVFVSLIDCSKCGCENKAQFYKYLCMQAELQSINNSVTNLDYLTADKIIQRLNQQCTLLNENCGCS